MTRIGRTPDTMVAGFLVFGAGETLIVPFFAYPFLAVTLFGWAWVHYRDAA